MGISDIEMRRRGLLGLAGASVSFPAVALFPAGTADAAAEPWPRPGGGDDRRVARRIRLERDPGSVVAAADLPLVPADVTARPGGVLRTPALATTGFSLVGVTWRGGDGSVRARVRKDGRGWGPWRELRPLHDRPDPGTAEGGKGVSGTEPTWVGRSEAIQVEIRGDQQSPVLALIDPGRRAADEREVDGGFDDLAAARGKGVPEPPLRTRKDWGADPDLREGSPSYCRTIQQVHVHHTVNSNSYRRREVAGIIRGIYRYHTQSLGWSDIGYNFLVDKFGRIWVGRAGGPRRPVHGAHTLGFNSTSTGVSVIGNFQDRRPGDDVIRAIAHLAAWKLDKYDRKPRGKVVVFSHGSDKYPYGEKVLLPVIDGHRHTNDTSCPGDKLFDKLPEIRRRAARRVRHFND